MLRKAFIERALSYPEGGIPCNPHGSFCLLKTLFISKEFRICRLLMKLAYVLILGVLRVEMLVLINADGIMQT